MTKTHALECQIFRALGIHGFPKPQDYADVLNAANRQAFTAAIMKNPAIKSDSSLIQKLLAEYDRT